MDKEQVGLFLLGAAAQKTVENTTGYAISTGIDAIIGTTPASKFGALIMKICTMIPPVDPITATFSIGLGLVGGTIAYSEANSSNYDDSPDDYYMPALSGIYSG